MIYNAEWRDQFERAVKPRLFRVHQEFTAMAGRLRDANTDIWSEAPSDDTLTAGRPTFNLQGWRVHYGKEHASLSAFNTAHGALVQDYDPQAKTALDGYLASLATIGPAFNTVLNQYKDGQGRIIQEKITQAHRDALADAIEAELA